MTLLLLFVRPRRPEMKEVYEEKYARYRATIDALANVWDVFQ